MEKTNNKTIAKNTLLLYFRMMVTMVISLYTSRVIMQVLGVDDYGIYKAVGGVVGFLSFLNSALGTGASRFITFGLGEGDKKRLKNIFSTTLTAHVVLALVIILIAETVGLWFLYNKMVIPAERMDAAVFVYHLSVISVFFSLSQVPFNACIIAHERMTVFAYVSIIDAFAKLLIVFLLPIGGLDKLKFYALMLCLLQIGILAFYRFYSVRHFEEVRLRLFVDKIIFKEIAGFSGWSLFASISRALNDQGILVLLNMFFSPAVVSARAISLQVQMNANQLVTNFQTAANPQIVKLYAANDFKGSKRLLIQTTCFSYYLMLLLSLPICLTARQLLELWLGVVPEYTVVFLQIIIVQSLFMVFDTSFYRALYAKGRLRENALLSPMLGFIQFPVVYVLFMRGYSPVALSWASLIHYFIGGLIIKPILIIKIVDYTWHDIMQVFLPCLKVTIISLPLPLAVHWLTTGKGSDFVTFLIVVIVSALSVVTSCWFFGFDSIQRDKLLFLVRKKLLNR